MSPSISAPALQVKAVSASPRGAAGIKQVPEVTKLIDVSVCIGRKACEVPCQEWNDLGVDKIRTLPPGTYHTLPDLEYNFWQLIKFTDTQRDGRLLLTLTKHPCQHCQDPAR